MKTFLLNLFVAVGTTLANFQQTNDYRLTPRADHHVEQATDDTYQPDLFPPFLWAPFNHMFNPMIPYWTFANELNWMRRNSRPANVLEPGTKALPSDRNGGIDEANKETSFPCYPNLQANLPLSKKYQRFGETHRCNGLYKCSNGRDESGCPNKCLEPLYSPEMFQRDCGQSKLRYQYNQESKQCEFFVYGGCVEKKNMFMKKSECERECLQFIAASADAVESRSAVPMEQIPRDYDVYENGNSIKSPTEPETEAAIRQPEGTIACSPVKDKNGSTELTYYNETDRCNGFYDCPNGDDERNCMSKCLGFRYTETVDILDCRASIPRWYYDFETQKCVKFLYGGCAVVPNQFLTAAECEYECAGIYVNRTWAHVPTERPPPNSDQSAVQKADTTKTTPALESTTTSYKATEKPSTTPLDQAGSGSLVVDLIEEVAKPSSSAISLDASSEPAAIPSAIRV